MADVKISGLPASTVPLAGTEVLPIVQGGTTKQVSIANVTAGRAIAATSVTTDTYKAASSSGGALQNSSGTNQLQWGGGGGNNLSVDVAININPANAAVAISPTGTGTVAISPAGALTINPTTASTMNNVAIGGTTAAAGTFTSVSLSTPLAVGSGGTGLATLAASRIPYGNGTSALNSSSSLTFTGTDLVVGAASPNVGCQLGNNGVFGAQRDNVNYVGYISNLTTSGNAGFLTFQYGTSQTEVGSISTNGSTTTYAITSDRRLKENIESITSEQSGKFIDSLLPRTYIRANSGEKESGFIADEFQLVAPGSVLREPNEVDENGKPRYQLIDASTPEVIANIVAELQSLRARLKAANIA
jgi:hypothetical protein